MIAICCGLIRLSRMVLMTTLSSSTMKLAVARTLTGKLIRIAKVKNTMT